MCKCWSCLFTSPGRVLLMWVNVLPQGMGKKETSAVVSWRFSVSSCLFDESRVYITFLEIFLFIYHSQNAQALKLYSYVFSGISIYLQLRMGGRISWYWEMNSEKVIIGRYLGPQKTRSAETRERICKNICLPGSMYLGNYTFFIDCIQCFRG